MYSRFVFGNFSNFSDHDLNKRQRHPYGAFLDVFNGTDDQNLFWHCKKRMFQHKIRATLENAATDRGRYGKLKTDLKDQYTLKSDVYPSDITTAFNLLENYSSCLLYTSDAADE